MDNGLWLETELPRILSQLRSVYLEKINVGPRYRVRLAGPDGVPIKGSLWFEPRSYGIQMCPNGSRIDEAILQVATNCCGKPDKETRGYFIWRRLSQEDTTNVLLAIDETLSVGVGVIDATPTPNPDELHFKVQELLNVPLDKTACPAGQVVPNRSETVVQSIVRDPAIVAWVRLNANGLCELCNSAAPFRDHNGNPFLEVHHVVTLANGGADTVANAVALCPNCHRAVHYSEDAPSLTKRLYHQVDRLSVQ